MLRGWIALTGTPGVGKTEVADRLRRRGIPNVDLGRLAHDYELVEGIDDRRTAAIVNPRRIAPLLERLIQKGSRVLLEGHWSHEVPGITAAIVLRLRPRDLRPRLERRGWPDAKIEENLEAEAIDLITQEAVATLGPRRVHEIDTTERSRDQIEQDLYRILTAPARGAPRFPPGRVDWSKDILDGYVAPRKGRNP